MRFWGGLSLPPAHHHASPALGWLWGSRQPVCPLRVLIPRSSSAREYCPRFSFHLVKKHHISTQPAVHFLSSSCRLQKTKSRKTGTRLQVKSFHLKKLGANPLLDVITLVFLSPACDRQSTYPDLAWEAKQKCPLGEALLRFPDQPSPISFAQAHFLPASLRPSEL